MVDRINDFFCYVALHKAFLLNTANELLAVSLMYNQFFQM